MLLDEDESQLYIGKSFASNLYRPLEHLKIAAVFDPAQVEENTCKKFKYLKNQLNNGKKIGIKLFNKNKDENFITFCEAVLLNYGRSTKLNVRKERKNLKKIGINTREHRLQILNHLKNEIDQVETKWYNLNDINQMIKDIDFSNCTTFKDLESKISFGKFVSSSKPNYSLGKFGSETDKLKEIIQHKSNSREKITKNERESISKSLKCNKKLSTYDICSIRKSIDIALRWKWTEDQNNLVREYTKMRDSGAFDKDLTQHGLNFRERNNSSGRRLSEKRLDELVGKIRKIATKEQKQSIEKGHITNEEL